MTGVIAEPGAACEGMTGGNQARVRVWFGDHVISDFAGDTERADAYATLVRQRFAGLRVTVENDPPPTARALPNRRLWELSLF